MGWSMFPELIKLRELYELPYVDNMALELLWRLGRLSFDRRFL